MQVIETWINLKYQYYLYLFINYFLIVNKKCGFHWRISLDEG